MMKMYFNNDRDFTLLFKNWSIHTKNELATACVVMVLFGMVFEGIKFLRVKLQKKPLNYQAINKSRVGYGAIDNTETDSTVLTKRCCSLNHLLHSLLCMVQLFTGYLLMLAFMTYNAWIGASVILGVGIGFYLFDSQFSLPYLIS